MKGRGHWCSCRFRKDEKRLTFSKQSSCILLETHIACIPTFTFQCNKSCSIYIFRFADIFAYLHALFFLNFNSAGKACNETQLSNVFHARLMPIPRTVIFHVNSFNFLSDLFVNAQIFSRHVLGEKGHPSPLPLVAKSRQEYSATGKKCTPEKYRNSVYGTA
jgi:hypothetical protein